MLDSSCVELVKEFEGFSAKAYKCPAGVWTIGYGHTEGVKPDDRTTKPAAERMLKAELEEYAERVEGLCKVVPNSNQLSAMTSLAFNIGVPQFKKSTVLSAHNKGATMAAGRAFNMWVKATVNGKKVDLPGLVSRRAQESALYLKAVKPEDKTPMAQMVTTEARGVVNKTNVAAATAAGAGAVATVADTLSKVTDVTTTIDTGLRTLLNVGPIVLGVIAVIAIGYIVYRRFIRHQEGWV